MVAQIHGGFVSGVSPLSLPPPWDFECRKRYRMKYRVVILERVFLYVCRTASSTRALSSRYNNGHFIVLDREPLTYLSPSQSDALLFARCAHGGARFHGHIFLFPAFLDCIYRPFVASFTFFFFAPTCLHPTARCRCPRRRRRDPACRTRMGGPPERTSMRRWQRLLRRQSAPR